MYKYYNMDQVVAQALTVYSKISGTLRPKTLSYSNGHKRLAAGLAL
jgi:hypothetical protein